VNEKYKDCFPVTAETFEMTADKWIKKVLHSNEEGRCGFCNSYSEEEKRQNNFELNCLQICPASKAGICGAEGSTYDDWCTANTVPMMEQIALKILEQVYDLAAEMGILEQLRSEGWE
jgi:hypothetical protein